MKKFSQAQIKEIESYRDKLADARRIMEEALERAQVIVDEALEEVNTIREEAGEFVRELYGKADDYYEERSDNWKEGDAGNAYQDWMNAIDNAASELEEETTFDLIDHLEEPLSAIEELSQKLDEDELPRSPEE